MKKKFFVGSGEHQTECLWTCMSNVSSFLDEMWRGRQGNSERKTPLLTLEGGVCVAMLREQSFPFVIVAIAAESTRNEGRKPRLAGKTEKTLTQTSEVEENFTRACVALRRLGISSDGGPRRWLHSCNPSFSCKLEGFVCL